MRAPSDPARQGRPEAAEWARKGIASAPDRSLLAPRELAEYASLQRRAGDEEGAKRASALLDSIVYRHPAFERTGTATLI